RIHFLKSESSFPFMGNSFLNFLYKSSPHIHGNSGKPTTLILPSIIVVGTYGIFFYFDPNPSVMLFRS
ncbi:MAG: hypothetical protein ACRD9Q_01610, partial [Nitrososphaeraceae archaeon]